MSKPEPSTIAPPSYMSAFQNPSLKFLCLGRAISGLAGEKEKVVCIIKPKVVVASIRGTVSQEMVLTTVVSIHYQDSDEAAAGPSPSPTRYTDMVLTDVDGRHLFFSLPKRHVLSFVGVATYYCPPDTPVHEITGSKVPLFESLAGVTRRSSSVLSTIVSMVQHVGQSDRNRQLDEARKLDADETLPNSSALPVTASALMAGGCSSPMDASVVEMLDAYDTSADARDGSAEPNGDLNAADRRKLSSIVHRTNLGERSALPKPRARSAEPVVRLRDPQTFDEYPGALQRMQLHRAPNERTKLDGDRKLPGDDELHSWKDDVIIPRRGGLDSSGPARPVFGEGGTVYFRIPVASERAAAAHEESSAVSGVIGELKRMQDEIAALKRDAANQRYAQNVAAAAQPPSRSNISPPDEIDSDTDEPVRGPLISSAMAGASVTHLDTASGKHQVAAATTRAPRPVMEIVENTRGSLLPLLSAATQEAALRAIDELAEIQKSILDTKNLNPFVFRQLESMKDPIRTLHKIVAPRDAPMLRDGSGQTVHPSGGMSGEFVPMWALVDFGEVNYDRIPPTLRQYHRVIARRIDDAGESHLMIATRQQFAIDDGYTSIPFSSIVDLALGAQPRPVPAQRLTMDGTVTRADEYLSSDTCLSLRTRLQHILLQFENKDECQIWARVLQDVVMLNTRKAPMGKFVADLQLQQRPTIEADDL